MYAIIQSGGHQIRVTKGGTAIVAGTVGEPGDAVTLDQVLLVEKDGGEILAGAPFVANARITAVVDGEKRGPKIRVFKKKRRKGMRRTKGHRAVYTQVRITDILV
jgi:large subunit ribosomal protein L21